MKLKRLSPNEKPSKRQRKWPIVRPVAHKNGTRAWLIDARINGTGERLFFKSRIEADSQADVLRTKRANDGKMVALRRNGCEMACSILIRGRGRLAKV